MQKNLQIETEELTPMQKALLRVLIHMPLQEEDKVLITILLQMDEQIYEFLIWLKEEVPENQIKVKESEIMEKAVQISKSAKQSKIPCQTHP